MKKTAIIVFLIIALAASAFGAPKNIILFIGDGMGLATVAGARISSQGPGGRLAMDTMPVSGFATTYSANALITDSAAAGTALATGTKTNNGMLGMTPDGKRLKSILEAAMGIKKSTGLVTTTTISHATPASFASHVSSRGDETDIACQLLEDQVDVLMGGGMQFFAAKDQPGSKRTDDLCPLAEAKAAGYTVATNSDELAAAKGPKILGLFENGYLTTKAPEPPLSTLTTKALDTLSKDKDGFFLMVEGGQIDFCAHANDFDGAVNQLLEFDRAVAAGLDYARKHGDTLVIVTADHETGGLTLLTNTEGQLQPSWSSKGHTGVPVPIYAFGPGSEQFAGLMDNTDIPKKMAKMWGVKIGLLTADKPAAQVNTPAEKVPALAAAH
ncbi:MAG: alkaline phosphatase [Armatimonadota bacterium]